MAEKFSLPALSVDLGQIKSNFESYVHSFDLSVPMIDTKYRHSYDVMDIGKRLTDELPWSEDAKNTGIAACLLHDIGRFSQYRDFGTYYDGASVDHGDRGYETLLSLSPHYSQVVGEQAWKAVLLAVKWHNKKTLPELSSEVMPFCRLARDADKLGVFDLVRRRMEEDSIGELLPRHKIDAPLSQALLDEVEANGSGSYSNASSLQDFLLIQLTWVLDLNFAPSLHMLEESGVVRKICAQFPSNNERVQSIIDGLLSRIAEQKTSKERAENDP